MGCDAGASEHAVKEGFGGLLLDLGSRERSIVVGLVCHEWDLLYGLSWLLSHQCSPVCRNGWHQRALRGIFVQREKWGHARRACAGAAVARRAVYRAGLMPLRAR